MFSNGSTAMEGFAGSASDVPIGGPAAALAVTKRALDVEFGYGLEQALEYEARVQAELMEHPDYREAYEAFREKRQPNFAR